MLGEHPKDLANIAVWLKSDYFLSLSTNVRNQVKLG